MATQPGKAGGVIIELPYPSPLLSPNGRAHWGIRARQAKKHRQWAAMATRAAPPQIPASGPIGLLVTMYPSTNRRRDADNALASLKSSLDGIADALGVDDSRFRPRVQFGEPVKRPCVVVTFDPPETWQAFGDIAQCAVASLDPAA